MNINIALLMSDLTVYVNRFGIHPTNCYEREVVSQKS